MSRFHRAGELTQMQSLLDFLISDSSTATPLLLKDSIEIMRSWCKSRCTSTADAEIHHPHTPTHASRGIDKDYDKDYDKEHSHTPILPHPHTHSAGLCN